MVTNIDKINTFYVRNTIPIDSISSIGFSLDNNDVYISYVEKYAYKNYYCVFNVDVNYKKISYCIIQELNSNKFMIRSFINISQSVFIENDIRYNVYKKIYIGIKQTNIDKYSLTLTVKI